MNLRPIQFLKSRSYQRISLYFFPSFKEVPHLDKIKILTLILMNKMIEKNFTINVFLYR